MQFHGRKEDKTNMYIKSGINFFDRPLVGVSLAQQMFHRALLLVYLMSALAGSSPVILDNQSNDLPLSYTGRQTVYIYINHKG